MTDRERWAVYPLLFLTLGIAIKDKLIGVVNVDRVQCTSMHCKAVVVTDPNGKQQVLVSSNGAGGYVRAIGNENNLSIFLGYTPQLGGLLLVDRQNRVHPGTVFATPAQLRDPPGDQTQPNEAQPDAAQPRDPPKDQPAKPSAADDEP